MPEKVISAGDHIASKCTKCKDTTNHTIVAMVGEKVVRVQCNTCNSTHNYRAEVKKKQSASRNTKASTAGTASRATAATSRTANKAQRDWDDLLETAKPEEATPYSMNTPMTEGLLIMHPTFGLGQVISTTKPNKMDVRFQSGVKLLRCKLG